MAPTWAGPGLFTIEFKNSTSDCFFGRHVGSTNCANKTRLTKILFTLSTGGKYIAQINVKVFDLFSELLYPARKILSSKKPGYKPAQPGRATYSITCLVPSLVFVYVRKSSVEYWRFSVTTTNWKFRSVVSSLSLLGSRL